MVGAAARLHGNDAGRQLRQQCYQAVASHTPAQHHGSGRIQPNQAAAVLAEINADDRHISHVPPLRLPDQGGGEGRAIP
jgi:hypothetical protein